MRGSASHTEQNMTARCIGQEKERLACKFLQQKGLHLIQSNYHCLWGEIDLIMEDNGCIVFTEVRFRKTTQYGPAEATVSPAKQRKLIKAAQCYLLHESEFDDIECRFDVVGIHGPDHQEQVIWIKNAFGVDQVND